MEYPECEIISTLTKDDILHLLSSSLEFLVSSLSRAPAEGRASNETLLLLMSQAFIDHSKRLRVSRMPVCHLSSLLYTILILKLIMKTINDLIKFKSDIFYMINPLTL